MKWNTYIRQLSNSRLLKTSEVIDNANLLLKNKFIFDHQYDMEPTDTIVDFNPIEWQKSPNGDPEWLYMLKRQEYLIDLLQTFYITGEKKYLKKAKQLIFEWIRNNLSVPQTWRTIDTGIRLLNWAPIIPVLRKNNFLETKELDLINISVQKQVKYLKQYYISKYDISNWGVLITTGILVYNAINEKTISLDDTKWAMEKLKLEIALQVNHDGTHWEQSPLYFVEVWRSVLCVYAAYRQKNIKFSSSLLKSLKRMHYYAAFLVKPNRLLLQQGDTDSISIDALYDTSAIELNMQNVLESNEQISLDFILIELHHQPIFEKNTKRKPISENNNYSFDSIISGNYYWRSNLSSSADYWHIYNGTLGSGHGHAALGHIDLTLNGHDVFIDPGRFTYVDSVERRYLKSVKAHNVIEIDNIPFTSPSNSWKFSTVGLPLNNTVQHSKHWDIISINYLEHPDAPSSPSIFRYFIWLKKYEIMVIIDIIKASGNHNICTRFNLAPDLHVISSDLPLIVGKQKFKVKIASSNNNFHLKNSFYSPRYNRLNYLTQLNFNKNINDFSIQHTIIARSNKFSEIKKAKIRQSGQPKKNEYPQHCYAFEIKINQNDSILISLQWLNTFIGQKLYLVNDQPLYGTLNILYLHNGKISKRFHVK